MCLDHEQSHREALEKAGISAVEAFRKFETFTQDLSELTLPNFMFGYTSAVNEVGPLLSEEDLDSSITRTATMRILKDFVTGLLRASKLGGI